MPRVAILQHYCACCPLLYCMIQLVDARGCCHSASPCYKCSRACCSPWRMTASFSSILLARCCACQAPSSNTKSCRCCASRSAAYGGFCERAVLLLLRIFQSVVWLHHSPTVHSRYVAPCVVCSRSMWSDTASATQRYGQCHC